MPMHSTPAPWTAGRQQPRGASPRRVTAALRVCVAALLIVRAEAKSVAGRFQLEAGGYDSGPEYEISKFSFLQGTAHISGNFRYKSADSNWMTSPALYLFPDSAWPAYHKLLACEDKVQHAHSLIQIGKIGNTPNMGMGRQIGVPQQVLARSHPAETKLAYEGDEAVWSFKWELESTERPHGWFVIAADCALEQYNTKVSPMSYEVTMLNPGDSHLPADEYGLPMIYYLAWLGLLGYAVFCARLLQAHIVETKSKVHLVVKLLIAAYGLQFLSLTCEIIHIWRFMSNGFGSFLMDFVSELSEGLSSLLISFVLICLACGWTLVESEGDARKTNAVATMLQDPRKLFKSTHVGVVLALGVVVLNFLLVSWNKMSDDSFAKFHDHESPAGRVLVGIRFFLGAVYVASIVMTIRTQQARGSSESLQAFLKRLLVFGSAWFLCFPVLVLCSGFFVHYQRHRVVAGGVLLTQSVCLGVLAHQFLAETSAYSRLSTAWESGLLPGLGGAVKAVKGVTD